MSDVSAKDAMPEYQARKTATIIQIFGAVIIAAGIITALIGLYYLIIDENSSTRIVLLLSGLGTVLAGCLIFIIATLSEDVHKLLYDYEYISLKDGEFHHRVMEQLYQIEEDQDDIKMALSMNNSKNK